MADTELEIDVGCDTVGSVFEKSASAPSSPTERSNSIQRELANIGCHANGRRVTFPDDEAIVTGYFEAPDPWSDDYCVSTDNIVAAYRAACWKQGVKPLQKVLQQLQAAKMNENIEFELNLKNENLDSQHCEALEEIFKRLQFKTLELESCHLVDEGATAIFDMIEYYDSTSHLNISGNRGIGSQGWHACSKMLKKTPCMQYLDASNTAQNEQSLLILGRAFRTGSNLSVLHLESCGLTGRTLVILVAALKLNTTLLELHLGENRICPADGLQLGNLLRSNSTLELLNVQCNNLQDLGTCHLMDGLCQQIPSNGNCLRSLNLSNNHLSQNAMAHVNQALLVSISLTNLDVSYNNACNEGIHMLKQGLLHNQVLQSLILKNNGITCEGAVTLAEYIADNQHITHLDLQGNSIKVAGIMALSLSMKHNHSIINLELDAFCETDLTPPDGIHDQEKLMSEILDYCSRNKSEMEEDSQESEKNFVPTVHNDQELAALYSDKTPVYRTSSVNPSAHPPPIGMVCSASFPAGSKPQHHMTSNARNRFQVCRVFLESDASKAKDDPVFFPSSPSENSEDSQSSMTEMESSETSKESVEISDVGTKRPPSIEEPQQLTNGDNPVMDSGSQKKEGSDGKGEKSSTGKPVKKISFLNPDEADKDSRTSLKNRRMSTPAPASIRLVKEHQNLKLQLGKQLESLDLRSSVPLSPTRLREGLVFPDPFDFKLPPESSP